MRGANQDPVERQVPILEYRRSICDLILPFWADAGFDERAGVFRERLDFAKRDCPAAPRRAMVQARQIYVYSAAAKDGGFPQGGELADRAMRSLFDLYLDGRDPGRGFAFSLDASGKPHSQFRESYTHAFILLSLASLYELTGERSLLSAAEATLGFVDRYLACPDHGGVLDGSPSAESVKRQNPLMHLLEALLALHEAAPEGPYLERAQGVLRLFEKRLFQQETGVLPEVFTADWSLAPSTAAYFEPGHHFEWIWLLGWSRQLGGGVDPRLEDRLWESAQACGLDPRGWCYDTIGLDRRPLSRSTRLGRTRRASKRASRAIKLARRMG